MQEIFKQRQFPCWRWCSSVLGRTNAQKIFHNICLGPFSTDVFYDQFFNSPPLCTHMYAFRVTSFLRMWFHRFDTLLSHFDFACLLSFLILFCLRNSRFDVHVHFLASHSVPSNLPRKSFSLMVASKYLLFYLSWSLTKLSYANVRESYSRRTTTVIVTVLTKVLSCSWETVAAITLGNSNNNNNNTIRQAL